MFKVGDRVECIDNSYRDVLTTGCMYEVLESWVLHNYSLLTLKGVKMRHRSNRFIPFSRSKPFVKEDWM